MYVCVSWLKHENIQIQPLNGCSINTPPQTSPPHSVYWGTCVWHMGHVSSCDGRFWLGEKVIFFFKAPRKSGWLNASAFSKTTGLGAQLSVWKVFFLSVSELFSLNWISAHLPEAWRYYSHRNSVVENLRDLTQVIYVPDKVQINKNIFLLTSPFPSPVMEM